MVSADPVLSALQAALDRILAAPDDDAPYYAAAQVVDLETVEWLADHGALHTPRCDHTRNAVADVRIGSPDRDSNHPIAEPPARHPLTELPLDGVGPALDLGLWSALERAWAEARERWGKVRASRSREPGPDLCPADAVVHLDGPRVAPVPHEPARALLLAASAALSAPDWVTDAGVSFSTAAETRWFASSEGTALRWSRSDWQLALRVEAVGADGTALRRDRSLYGLTIADLPSAEALAAEVRALLNELDALRHAPEEPAYTGPVCLSDRAAGVFFHEVLGHRIEGHRHRAKDDARTLTGRLGALVLPAFLSVVDDPTRDRLDGAALRGHYPFDDQGVVARPTTIVRNGVLVDFLQSRASASSNGHGRAEPGFAPVSRQGNLIVDADGAVSEGELRAALIAAAASQGLPYALALDDLDGGFTWLDRENPNVFHLNVTRARRVWVDGRPDEPVRALSLSGTPLDALMRITLAGPRREPFNGVCGAESGGVPVSASSPALLLSRAETQPARWDHGLPVDARAPSAPPLTGADPLSDLAAHWATWAPTALNPGLAPEARASITLWDRRRVWVDASFGVRTHHQDLSERPMRAELVLGDGSRDTARLGQDEHAADPIHPVIGRFVPNDGVHPLALSREIWLALRMSAQQAARRWPQRRALRDDQPPDHLPDPPQRCVRPGRVAVDSAALEAIAVAGSARLRGRGLQVGSVSAWAVGGRTAFADSAGRVAAYPEGWCAVTAVAHRVLPTGVIVQDLRRWVAPSTDALPPVAEILDAIDALADAVTARAEESPPEPYDGPAIFEGDAAADLFRYLASQEICGTPAEPDHRATWSDRVRGGARVGRRLLPAGWRVESEIDDSGLLPPVDREGCPPVRRVLVEDGDVRDLLMTQTPRHDRRGSTGSARGELFGEWEARPGAWSVSVPREPAFDAAVATLRARAGVPAVLVVYRFEPGRFGRLPRPTHAVLRHPDGRETPLLAIELADGDRRVLRDLAFADGTQRSAYLAPPPGFRRAPLRDGLPTVLTCPQRVVLSTCEAVFPGARREQHRLPPPIDGLPLAGAGPRAYTLPSRPRGKETG